MAGLMAGVALWIGALSLASLTVPSAWAQGDASPEALQLEQRGTEAVQAGRLPEAEQMFKRALAIHERTVGPTDVATGKCLVLLAVVYYTQGRFNLAEPLIKRARGIYEKTIGRDHVALGPVLYMLGAIYNKQSRPAEAEPLLKRSLALQEKFFGRQNPQILPNLDDLAEVYRLQGREADAEALAKRALAIRKKTPGQTPQADEAQELTDRALALRDAERVAEAEPLFKRALEIREKTLGAQHVGTGDAYNNLGTIYYRQGRYAEAEPLFKRAQATYEKAIGREHQFTDPMRFLALSYAKLGRHAEAEPLFRRVLATRERVFGPLTPDVVLNLEELAEFLRHLGRDIEAEPFAKRALAIRERVFAPKAPQPEPLLKEADELSRRGTELFNAGRHAEARPLFEKAMQGYEKAFGPEHPLTGSSLTMLGLLAFGQGRYSDAEPLMKRALAIYEKVLGPDHHITAAVLHGLAMLDAKQGRYAEAEQRYKRALASRVKAYGSDHPDVTLNLNDLADLYRSLGRHADAVQLRRGVPLPDRTTAPELRDQVSDSDQFNRSATDLYKAGRYAEAEPLAKQALALAEKSLGPEHPDTAGVLHNLGLVYEGQGRYAAAEPVMKRALAIYEKVHGRNHPGTGNLLHSLANLYSRRGRYAEAEPHYKRALAIRESALGRDNPEIADNLNNLATLYRIRGLYAEAEGLLKRALAIQEAALGPNHQASANAFMSLATVYALQDRGAEAEPLFKRAMTVLEGALGQDHPYVAVALNNLAAHYHQQQRHAEAEPLYKRAHAINEKALGPEHPDTAIGLGNLAELYADQKRFAEAGPLMKRALAIAEKGLGPDHDVTADRLANLADLHWRQGHHAEAEPLFKRAAAIYERSLGRDHPRTAKTIEGLSRIRADRKDWQGAYDFIAQATAIHMRTARRESGGAQAGDVASAPQAGGDRKAFVAQAYIAAHLVGWAPERLPALTRETYTIAQWVQRSEAATALSRMASRFAKGESALARVVRQRQDLAGQYRLLDRSLIASVGKAPVERDPRREGQWRQQMLAIEKQIREIDARLTQTFPEYAVLANPEPLTVEETQAQLRPDEALYQVIVGEEGALAWVVTREDARWRSLALDEKSLSEHVEALRCGLDASLWDDARGGVQRMVAFWTGQPPTKAGRCRRLVGADPDAQGNPPFDEARAHALYRALFAPFEDIIKDKRLIVVPHGPLAALPFQVLVTEVPDAKLRGFDRYRKASWLIARQPVTVLPSVASLRALRRAAGRSGAPNAFAGFGNPLLSGSSGADRRAWDRQTCAGGARLAARGPAVPLRGALRDFFSGGLADVEAIRRQEPLPETADELCAVAAALGSGAVFLGSQATEQQLRELNARQALRTFRVLHFATHGLIAAETRQVAGGLAEPALILTPPQAPSETDDGLLTASEAAQLDLDADWVILSACNTAAGSGDAGTQALSGLARGFLYAGTRALLVSHWYVTSEAAVRLVTGTFGEMKRDASVGRAEALRRAMLAQIAEGGLRAHPSYWAPFVIVGDGG
jgi:tetratricopeptide (TPR) repeat protein/CHAT domain-containing protein